MTDSIDSDQEETTNMEVYSHGIKEMNSDQKNTMGSIIQEKSSVETLQEP